MEEIVNETFIFHAEWIADLPQRFREKFTMIAVNYAIFGILPTVDEDSLEFSEWIKIKRRIDADKNAYKETCEKRAENARIAGIKSGEKRRNNQNLNNRTDVQKMNDCSENRTTVQENEQPLTTVQKNERLEHEYDNEFDSDIEFEYDTHTEFVAETAEKVCENQKNDKETLFFKIWDEFPDVFGIRTTGLLRPNDFHTFFKNPNVTSEYIQKGMDNFVKSVKSGITERRYIPKSAENFILNGTLNRFQELPQSPQDKGKIAIDRNPDNLARYKPKDTAFIPPEIAEKVRQEVKLKQEQDNARDKEFDIF